MGKRIAELAAADKELTLSCLLEYPAHPEIGQNKFGVKVSADLAQVKNSDVIIDFTSPEATLKLLAAAVEQKKPLIIGTTGLTKEQTEEIVKAGKKIPIIFSSNMSVGVNTLFRLIRETAAKLKDYKFSIVEAHHIHKKDAPSGTAKTIAEIIEQETGRPVTDIRSIREGEIIGDHEVVMESDVDTIKLSHSAKTRDIFVKGTLLAAKWIVKQKPGRYSMQDVLR